MTQNKVPATEAGREEHREWHVQHVTGCGSRGCGFLSMILSIEAEMDAACSERNPLDSPYTICDHTQVT